MQLFNDDEYPADPSIVWSEYVDENTVVLDCPSPEVAEIIYEFGLMLLAVSGDGRKKRLAGLKPLWKNDDSHIGAIYRHLQRWQDGETTDKDSGQHPLAHAGWRCLATAYRETHPDECESVSSTEV